MMASDAIRWFEMDGNGTEINYIDAVLCASRHEVMVDGRVLTEASIFPQVVENVMDFDGNKKAVEKWLKKNLGDYLHDNGDEWKRYVIRIVVTGLTPVLHAFLNAIKGWGDGRLFVQLGHYDRDSEEYVFHHI